MHFIHPIYFLVACLLIIAVPIIATIAGVRRKKALRTLLGSSLDDSLAVKCSYAARRFRIFFLLMAMVFLAIAATRPFWSSKMVPFESKGRDLLILFDVSKSMLSSDLTPSRLEHAKYILREIVKADPQDHFGLVAFAGNAYLTCPLTSDPVAFEQYVNELNPSLVPIGGTNLELALNTAVRAFKVASSNNRAIILLTDGDELTGNSSKIINELKRRNIPLFVIGLGDPNTGAPVKDENGNYRRDAQGKLITTKLNEASLQKLAISSGGIYVRSTITDTGVSQITNRIDQLGTAQRDNKGKKTLPVERFPLFLIASAIMLLFYYLISESPAKKLKSSVIPLLLLTALVLPQGIKAEEQNNISSIQPATPQALSLPLNNKQNSTWLNVPNKINNNQTNPGATSSSNVALPNTQEKLPEDPQKLYNLALEQQKNNNPNAEKLYEEVLKRSEKLPSLRAKTLQNLGVNIHNKARAIVGKSLQELKAQQLDNTLKTLSSAQEQLKGAEELYTRALATANTPDANLEATASTLQQLALDKNKIEELKKKIEELKKQQQKAQEQAQKAKDEQQKQQQQNNNQNKQQKQDKQNNNQNRQQKQQQNTKDNQQQKAANEINKASNEAQKLQNQAQQLKQDNLAKAAQKAKEELDKASLANKEKKDKEAQKHINEAIKALNSQKEQQKQQQQQQDNNKNNKDNKNQQKQQQQQKQSKEQQNPQPGKQQPKKEDLKNAQELLKLLNDEENQRRKDLQRVPNNRRMQVEKDW